MITKLKNQIYQFLRKTQKYTGTDNVYLAKGGFWLTLSQILSMAISLLLALAFANLLDPITYGNYRYILSLIGILVIFGLAGIGTAVIQAVSRGMEGSFCTGFKTKLKWGAIGSLVAVGGAIYYFIRGNYLLPIPLLISAIFLPLMHASQIYGSFLAGRKLFNIQIKYNTLNQIISAGAIIAVLFLTKNLLWLIAVYFVSHTFLNYFFYLITERRFQPNKKEDPQTLSYGKHLSLLGIIGTIASSVDGILVFYFLGARELAIYSFAITPVSQIRDLLGNISTLALPKFAKRSVKEINALLYNRLLKLFLIGGGIALVYILFAPYLFKIFFPQYLDSVFFSQLFAIGLIFAAPSTFIGPLFQSKPHLIKKTYIGTVTRDILLILLLLILGYLAGIKGIILARVISHFLGLCIGIFLWRRSGP